MVKDGFINHKVSPFALSFSSSPMAMCGINQNKKIYIQHEQYIFIYRVSNNKTPYKDF